MREFDLAVLTNALKEACICINYRLSDDMIKLLVNAERNESDSTGKDILGMIVENMETADSERIPICQDTGMAVVFLKIGQEVHLTGGTLETAVNEGIRSGYREGFLRKSVVSDPINRINTNDNTPAVIHTEIVPGDKVEFTLCAKGFGSENTSRLFMLKPADGKEGIKNAVIDTVKNAGANACPPMVIGIGIGGNFEKCAIMAKHALTRNAFESSPDPETALLEKELLEKINSLCIGPGGLGGKTTALAVNIETFPTHIAGLPVAVNICCHVNRHITVTL